MILLNICSIISKQKRDELEILIEGIKPSPILFLTETWLKPTDPNSLLPFARNYTIYRRDRERADKERGGGVVIMVPKHYPSMALSSPPDSPNFEAVWCKIICPQQTVNLGCVYRPPDKDQASSVNLSPYIQAHFANNQGPTVLAGDFNLRGINWQTLTAPNQFYQAEFLEQVHSFGLFQNIDFPTRKKNCLDLIFSNEPNLIQNCTTGPDITDCDHKTVIASLRMQKIRSKTITYRDYAKTDYSIVAPAALNIAWNLNTKKADVNSVWNSFKCSLTDFVNTYVPIKTVYSIANCQSSPKTSKLYRDKLIMYNKLKKNPTDPYLIHKYSEISRLAQRQKRADVIAAENKVLLANDPSQFWKFIKSKMSYKSSVPCILGSDGKTVLSNDLDKAERFNEYFCSVFSSPNDEIPQFNFPQSTNFISQVDFSPEIVFEKLHKLPNKLSHGPDGIPTSLYKNLAIPLAEPLSEIFKASFAQSRLPNDWQIANVVPIHKKGSTDLCSNYRPISLGCQACKTMESIINDALLNHFEGKFSKHQHGFLKNRSTVTQLLETLNDWTQALDNNYFIDVQYIDWAKAFNTISHPILIAKLRRYGVAGQLLDWISAFLKNRKQRVLIDGTLSSEGNVTSSVPQGSVLASTLFLIFINDLESVFKHSKIKLFADDSKYYIIFLRENSEQAKIGMQEDNQALIRWGKENKMKIAFTKCASLHLGHDNPCNEYCFDEFPIPKVNEIRDLGVIISKDLKFDSHITKICKSARATSLLIFRAFRNRSRTFLTNLFRVYVRSKLEYASSIWNPYLIKDIDNIEKIQRSFTKRIAGLQNLPYSERLKALGLERLELRRIHIDLVLVYKIINKQIDLNFDDFFSFKQRTHNHKTRGHNLSLRMNHCKKDPRKYFFSNRVIKWWNFLKKTTVNAKSLNSFKIRLKDEDLTKFIKGGGD